MNEKRVKREQDAELIRDKSIYDFEIDKISGTVARMKLSSFRYSVLVLLGLEFANNIGQAQESSQLQDTGRGLAEKHCARCHVVNDSDLFAGISSTPSFPLLVNHLSDWEERFLSFHTRLPHPSIVQFKGEAIDPDKPVLVVPVELVYSDIDALVAYARTLKKND